MEHVDPQEYCPPWFVKCYLDSVSQLLGKGRGLGRGSGNGVGGIREWRGLGREREGREHCEGGALELGRGGWWPIFTQDL